MFKSIDINFYIGYNKLLGVPYAVSFDIPKFSKILDIEIFDNSLLKIFYESNGDHDLKSINIKLIRIDNTTTINESMTGYEFFKTVTNNSMYLDSSGRVLTHEFISEKYLVFINFNMCVDEIRNDRLNQIINE